MMIRFAVIGAATLLFSASAEGQGAPQKQVVVSERALKSMIASKPKSKTPLAARVGMVRRSADIARDSKAAPTSVREISPPTKKK